jgi:hypothetical protein
LNWSALFRHIGSNHKEEALVISAAIITLIASFVGAYEIRRL